VSNDFAWRNERRRVGAPIFTTAPAFFLPNWHALFQCVDTEAGCVEGLRSVGCRHNDHHRRLGEQQFTDAMRQCDAPDRGKSTSGLGNNVVHGALGRLAVRLVDKGGHTLATFSMVAHDAREHHDCTTRRCQGPLIETTDIKWRVAELDAICIHLQISVLAQRHSLWRVAADDANEPEHPFTNPLFANLARAMAAQGPLQWDVARQTALMSATQGTAEHNVDPPRRVRTEELARVAAMHVREVAGLALNDTKVEVVNRATWVQHTLTTWKPFFDALAEALAQPATSTDGDEDPALAMLSNMSRLIAPSMLGMSVGTLVGKLATTTFGQYDLPLPREPHGRLVLVVSNVDHFADEWSIPRDDMVMWALTHEMVNHAVFSIEPIRARLRSLVEQFAGGFRADANSVAEGLTRLDVSSGDPMKILDSLLSDPTVLLGAARSSQQERLAPVLDAAMAAVVGFVDHQVDLVTARLLGGSTRIAEAVRRRRVAQTADRVFVERLLGVDLTTERVALGKRFIDGVVERAGEHGAQQLLASAESLPTPAELAAPGLWLARLETL